MKQVDARRLVVVDECGSNLALTPLYARAPKGQRAHGSVPRNRGKNTTLLGSLSLAGIGASMIIEGSVNAAAFEAYVEHILVPSLCAGQIVVMDASRARTKECGCVSSSRHVAVNCSTCQRILLITLPLKRPAPSSKRFCAGWVPGPMKRSKRPLGKPWRRSPLRMRSGGSLTAATGLLKQAASNVLAQPFRSPL